jgi:mono/diheme cytochrome c family protein
MKKLIYTNGMLIKAALIIITLNTGIASGQKSKEQSVPIPDNINKVFQTSCMPCHGINGGRFPHSRLNLSKWAGYGAEKEAQKAALICSTLSKGSMPPKSRRESQPELNPTKEQVDLICKWAESINRKSGKK